MPVNSTHPDFSTQKSSVCKDAYDGDVKKYVPKLTNQNNDMYNAYVQRGVYFNVTKRTTEAMVGAAIRKPFVTDCADAYIDGEQTLAEMVSDIIRGVFIKSRRGILVDWCDEMGTPKLITYEHDNIINWRADRSMVVLHEVVYEPKQDDKYELEPVDQYRELMINEEGNYQVNVYRKEGKKNETFRMIESIIPQRRGEPLDFIPFVFINPFDTSTNIYDPVITNLAQLNIGHFKNIVDLEHGAHFTAIPTPYYAGDFSEDMGGQVGLGAEFFLGFESGTQVGFLEFTGSGLSSLEARRENKEMQMATIGTTLIAHKSGVESADALKIRSAAETATLNNVVTATESGMQQALTIYKWWDGTEQEAQFEMSRDFAAATLTPQEMVALMQLYLNGTISQETYLENLFEGEITPDVEEEMQRLGTTQPTQDSGQT